MRYLVWTILCLLVNGVIIAQDKAVTEKCAAGKIHMLHSAAKTSVASPAEDAYDVKYVKFDVQLTNQSVAIGGSVTTHALVTAASMDAYVFELDAQFKIDSVVINGFKSTVITQGLIRSATLPVTLLNGQLFIACVYYHGLPEAGNGFFQAGLNNTVADPWGVKVTYTLSEPYMANKWWPCKQSLQDKIDSADIWITVPDNLKAGSNGLLQRTTSLGNGLVRYEWHTAYPIDYYLLSVCVAPYIDYSYYVTLPGVTGNMLVQNFVYDAPGALAKYKSGIDSTAQMLQHYSEIFGVYPFYKEKYGHCIVPLPGGLEHQTMTTLGDFGALLVAHELAHQWFGDHVTCATWKDIWLNEGFASYAEYLFLQKWRGNEAASGHMNRIHSNVLNHKEQRGSVYVDDTTNDDRIFDGRLSYDKPSAVIHMLRYLAGNDALFFDLLKQYQEKYAFSTATTNDFRLLAERILNKDLSVFFDQWIFKEGYPVYTASWNKAGDEVFIKLVQATSVPQSVSLFKTPLTLKLYSLQGDTVITIDNNTNEQYISLSWNKTLTGVKVDPDNWVLNGEMASYRDPELGLNEVISTGVTVFPNPATNYWCVVGLQPGCDVLLTDLSGRVVYRQRNETTSNLVIYNEGMAKGLYILHVSKDKEGIASLKLVKL